MKEEIPQLQRGGALPDAQTTLPTLLQAVPGGASLQDRAAALRRVTAVCPLPRTGTLPPSMALREGTLGKWGIKDLQLPSQGS